MADLDAGTQGTPAFVVSIGGERRRIVDGTVSSRINDRSYASFTLDLRHLPAVDLSSPVAISTSGAPDPSGSPEGEPRFSGHVVTARPTQHVISIEAEGARELVESSAGLLHAAGVHAGEIVHLALRSGGFPGDRMDIQGLDELPLEVFVVEMPVVGISVERVVSGPDVEFLPLADPGGGHDYGPFTRVADDIAARWGRPTARARAYVTGTLLHEAGQDGVDRIERALDALLATATYGFSRDPWQRDLPFDRTQLRARPRAIPVVYTQGTATGRRVIRGLAGSPIETHLDVTAAFERWSQLLAGRPSEELVRALRALRDAADEGRDAYDRCHALCTVLEYYAASSKPPHVVSAPAKRAVLRSLNDLEMTDQERERLRQIIGQVNAPPLLTRVRFQASQDGAPISDTEWTLIKKLRTARNDTIHGKADSSLVPEPDDLRWGVSIASRLLMYRWVAESA